MGVPRNLNGLTVCRHIKMVGNHYARISENFIFSALQKFFGWYAYVCPEFRLFRYGNPKLNSLLDSVLCSNYTD